MIELDGGGGGLVTQSCLTLCDPMNCSPPGSSRGPWDLPGKDTAMGCHFLLQGIFQTQESNPGLLHCRQILSQLSYKGSPIELLSLEKPELIARSRVAKISGEIGGHLHIFTDLEGFYRTLVKLPLN